MENIGPRKNRQGILGWLSGGRYGLERKLYILHRLSGLALILYLPLHVYVTSKRLQGEVVWKEVMGALHNPVLYFGEFLLFIAFAFHALNGLRLGLTELGFFVGEPERPVYPPVSSLNRQRPLMWVLMCLAAVAISIAGYDFLS
ncbi:MAG: succinate dehydrogenase, cytochrome b556 subunit [Candidatus Glassbacteria bacterium]